MHRLIYAGNGGDPSLFILVTCAFNHLPQKAVVDALFLKPPVCWSECRRAVGLDIAGV